MATLLLVMIMVLAMAGMAMESVLLMLKLFMDIMATLLLVMVMVLAMAGLAMESVRLMLNLFLELTLILFVNVMAVDPMAMAVDIIMVYLASMDKLSPDIKVDSQPSLFSLSVTTFSVLDIILGDR